MKIIYNYFRFLFISLSIIIIIITIAIFRKDLIIIFEWNLIRIQPLNLNIPLIIDKSGILFSSTVLFISANVLLFSNSYIVEEKERNRFLLIILLFILSINVLIFIPNIIILIIGWDGLGLVRFLLVIHYASPLSLAAGYITVLTNRIGDALIIVSIPLIILTLNFNPSIFYYNSELNLIIIILILAAITKRAQIPFSSWLPAAIAAPTPISALVHSSTLVTAGIFLIYRFYPLLSISSLFFKSLLLLSSLTILIAGLRAFKENDMKKIIALSTLRQLGLIIYSLAINLPELALFHLLTHATFKALIFIGAGNLILNISHSQDLRQFGNLYNKSPLTFARILISNISLAGFPFLAGYFSKDLIIEMSIFRFINTIIFFILTIRTIITLIYRVRFIYFIFSTRSNNNVIITISNSDKNINKRVIFITVYVILRGALLSWILVFPYIHPPLISFLKFIIITLLITTLFLIVIFVSYLKLNRISKNNRFFTRSIWFIRVFNSQFFLIINKKTNYYLYTNTDSTWNEIFIGQSIKTPVYSLVNSYSNWTNFLITTNFIIISIIIFLNLYFNSLKHKAPYWSYGNGTSLKIPVFIV